MFLIDERLLAETQLVVEWPLSSLLLKNDKHYPWTILVPRVKGVVEWMDLSQQEQYLLSDEISALSQIIKQQFVCDKLNIATLGNIVSQLHIHLVARRVGDKMWPEGIWQAHYSSEPHEKPFFDGLVALFSCQVQKTFK